MAGSGQEALLQALGVVMLVGDRGRKMAKRQLLVSTRWLRRVTPYAWFSDLFLTAGWWSL